MALNPNKDLKMYYSISEVAEMLDVSETLLRYWEKEFPNIIAPKKVERNIRQYTKDDIEQVRMVYNLLKVRGLKISAARDLLRKNKSGVRQTDEVVARLRAVREELLAIKKELDSLV